MLMPRMSPQHSLPTGGTISTAKYDSPLAVWSIEDDQETNETGHRKSVAVILSDGFLQDTSAFAPCCCRRCTDFSLVQI